MKKSFLILAVIIMILPGCELLKKATTVNIDTNLTANIPVVVAPAKSAEAGASLNAVSFSKSQDLTLASNQEIEPYLNLIEEVNLNSLVVTVNGLTGDQAINSLSLDVTGVGNIFTQNNITAANNSFTPSVTAAVLGQVATKLKNDKTITLTLSGSVSGPLSVTVSLAFDATIVASPL